MNEARVGDSDLLVANITRRDGHGNIVIAMVEVEL